MVCQWTLTFRNKSSVYPVINSSSSTGQMNMFHVLLYLIALIHLSSSWTQQYGDAASTSYVDYKGPAQKNWNYTTGLPAESSPSVSRNGVIFYPLRMSVIALSSSGSVLWETAISNISSDYLSNTLYSEEHDFVLVCGSVDVNRYQVVGLHASNGTVAWKSFRPVSRAPTMLSISTSADAVYVGGSGSETLVALRLVDGTLLWQRKDFNKVEMLMQTKIGPIGTTPLGKEIIIIPTNRSMYRLDHGDHVEKKPGGRVNIGNGRLYAFDTLDNKTLWYLDVQFSLGGQLAFSSKGIVFGNLGGFIHDQRFFGLNATNGSLIFYSAGICEPRWSFGLNGPVVDVDGNAYFSCNNQAFSVNPDGYLRWVSKEFGYAPVGSGVSPSLHPSGYIYFIHSDQTRVLALSTADGSLYKEYIVPELGYFEPPILLGNSHMYLIGYNGGIDNVSISLVAL